MSVIEPEMESGHRVSNLGQVGRVTGQCRKTSTRVSLTLCQFLLELVNLWHKAI